MENPSTLMSIAVVIPCRNDASYLNDCLEALSYQIRPADCIIVIDNDSTDNTREVAGKYDVHLITQPIQGIWPATSMGYDEALEMGADIIARVDADSIPKIDWLSRIERTFEANPRLDAVSGPGQFYGTDRIRKWLGENWYLGAMRTVLKPVFGHEFLFGSNFAMPSRVWRDKRTQVLSDRADIHDDFDLAMRFGPDAAILFDPDMVMPVSGRPFDTWHAFGTRIKKALVTLRYCYPEEDRLPPIFNPLKDQLLVRDYGEDIDIEG